jgi:peptidyl-tRNA hydrolase, PTH1 family
MNPPAKTPAGPAETPSPIRLVVGLGNPGPEYEATRHNAGFWWVQALADRLGARLVAERSYQGLAARHNRSGGEPLWLLLPMTYMNRSGASVAPLARFFKIEPHEILVVHDELDLPPGQARLKLGGSAAGHNGLKDIQHLLGSLNFWRLRLGIGHPGDRAEVVNFVLKKPAPAEREGIHAAMQRALDASELLLAGEMVKAQTSVHAPPPRPKPPRPPGVPGLVRGAGSSRGAAALGPGAAGSGAAESGEGQAAREEPEQTPPHDATTDAGAARRGTR